MNFSAKDIAERLGGDIVGDKNAVVSSPARIETGKPGNICFFANPKYEKYVYSSRASIIIVNRSFEPKEKVSATLIKVDDAYKAVTDLLEWFSQMKKSKLCGNAFAARFLMPSVHVSCSARIGKGTHIFPQVYLGPKVRIGRNCIIYPGVKIYRECVVGDNCIIHSNAVIGADGFGFAPCPDGTYKKIQQTGNVVIEDNVEIGANTTIDRSTMGSTIIRRGVKLDNLCHVAHNVEIGDNTVMAALSGIAGSAKVGKQCVIGGQCGIVGHLSVADHTTLGARCGVGKSITKEGEVLLGFPAMDHYEFMRAYSVFKKNGQVQK